MLGKKKEIKAYRRELREANNRIRVLKAVYVFDQKMLKEYRERIETLESIISRIRKEILDESDS